MAKKGNRREQIRELLALQERLGVEELAEALDVTSMTIRRDLTAMEKNGEIIRTYGGCTLRSSLVTEMSFSEKDDKQRPQKHAIARTVIGLIGKNQTVYLDTGTTAVHLARLLPGDQGIRVLTNNLRVAMELFARRDQGDSVDVTVLGGELATKSPDLVGEMAPIRMAEYRVDLAVLGADAIDPVRGEFYSADVRTAALSRAAQARARRTLVLADHSKFGKYSLSVVGQLGPNVTLITDEEIDPADHEAVESTGAEVVLAKTMPLLSDLDLN